MQVKFDVVG